MDAATSEIVRHRANNRCEYCRLPQAATPFISFHIEHIVATQHLATADDDPDNLALACDRCNAFKGPNLASIDPDSGAQVALFHPRKHDWPLHFQVVDGYIVGLTPTGRATVRLLNMNAPRRVALRIQCSKEDEDDR